MQSLITVFGGTGFLGKYVVRALARNGWRIRVAARNPLRSPQLKVMGEVGQIELARADLRQPESIALALEGAESVVNLVGVLAETGRQTFDALQAKGAAEIARAAAERGITRFIQVSAIGADARSPSAYARTKAAGETAVREAIPTATVLRPSIVFGPEDSFFNRFAAIAALSPVVPMVGADTRFQPVYAGDVGAAVAEAMKPGREAAGRTYELGGPGVYTFRQMMEVMLHDIQRKRTLLPVPMAVAGLIGALGDLQARLLPLPPPLTTDQVKLLGRDNVADPNLPGLADLGVEPTSLDAVLPTYLWRFRSGGQFAQPEGQNAASPQSGPAPTGKAAGYGAEEAG